MPASSSEACCRQWIRWISTRALNLGHTFERLPCLDVWREIAGPLTDNESILTGSTHTLSRSHNVWIFDVKYRQYMGNWKHILLVYHVFSTWVRITRSASTLTCIRSSKKSSSCHCEIIARSGRLHHQNYVTHKHIGHGQLLLCTTFECYFQACYSTLSTMSPCNAMATIHMYIHTNIYS